MNESSRTQSNRAPGADPRRIKPTDYPLTEQDRHELKTKRGFTDETVQHCRFGSVLNQNQLDALGIEAKFDELPSTIVIPVPGTEDGTGQQQFQLHKHNLEGVSPPLYVLEHPGADVVIAESPFKAAAAWQLGYSAIGLNGIWSHINRLHELRKAIKKLSPGQVIVHMDTEQAPDGPRDSLKLSLAYARALVSKDWTVVIVDLPDKYLTSTKDSDGKPFQKADLDGALAGGLTAVEWNAQIAAGADFWKHPASIETKVEALWLLHKGDLFTQPEDLKQLLSGQNAGTKTTALRIIAGKVRNLAFDEAAGKVDEVKLQAFEGELKKLSKAVGLTLTGAAIKNLLSPFKDQPASGAPTLKECGYTIRNSRVYRVGTGPESPPLLVSNVVPKRIQTGTLRYLRGPTLPLHLVTLEGRSDPIKVTGSVFDPAEWETAGQGRITIPGAGAFKQYIDHALNVEKIQTIDPALNQVMWVGTCKDGAELKLVEQTHFPQESEECVYHGMRLPESDTDDVFNLVARLYSNHHAALSISVDFNAAFEAAPDGESLVKRDPPAGDDDDCNGAPAEHSESEPTTVTEKGAASDSTIWLLWTLGTLFKPAFGDAYPHLAIEGHKESGKTTIGNLFVSRFGLALFSAADHFSTPYRTRKSFSNTNLPIIVDEVNRLRGHSAQTFVNVLNSAYNISYSTHGDRSKYFVLGAPAMILGQEWPFDDAALNAKVIILKLDGAAKDAEILGQLRGCSEKASLKRWAEFVCEYARTHDMCAAVSAAQEELTEGVEACKYDRTTEGGRTIWNYATILATADAAIAFGLHIDRGGVKQALSLMLCSHLGGASEEEPRRTIGQQFLADLVDELQSRSGRASLIFKVTEHELIFNLPYALRMLQSKGHIYDISTARSMADHLTQIGARYERRWLNDVQKRCCVVETQLLKSMQLDVSGLCKEHEDAPDRITLSQNEEDELAA